MTDLTRAVELVDLGAQRERLRSRIDAAIAAVVDHGQFILGPEVTELEHRLAHLGAARYAVSCASGTDALHLALLAWAVAPGDAVFVPTFSFAATAEVVALIGATPVFVDVHAGTFNLDAASLLEATAWAQEKGLRPAGVIAVDLFGQPADYQAIGEVAALHGMWVLADAAQSFGAALGGRPVGALADVTATSFFPAKPLGCYGDGGALFTDDEELAAQFRSLRAHGRGDDKYDNVRPGLNSRLDTLQAAILLAKLDVFADELARRRAVAARYSDGLSATSGVRVPAVVPGAESSWAHYTVAVRDRDRVGAELHQTGIATAVYYPRPLHRQTAYRRFPVAPGGLPVAERLAAEVLSLPMHPYLGAPDQARVIDALGAVASITSPASG